MSLSVEDKLHMSLDEIIRASHLKENGKMDQNNTTVVKLFPDAVLPPANRSPTFRYEPSHQKPINQTMVRSLSEEIAASRRELAPDTHTFIPRRNVQNNNRYNRPHPYRGRPFFTGFGDSGNFRNFNNFRGNNHRYAPLTHFSLNNFNRSLKNGEMGRRRRSTSVCSNRSGGSNYSSRSVRSNRSNFSNYSNRSNHSNKSNRSCRSNHSFRHYHRHGQKFHHRRGWNWKQYPFFNPPNRQRLNYEVQKKIREMQARDSGRTPLTKQEILNLETFTPSSFRTSLTTTCRFLSYMSDF